MKNTLIIAAIVFTITACSSSTDQSDDNAPADVVPTMENSDGANTEDQTGNGGTGDQTSTGDTTVDEPLALEVIGQDLLIALAGFQADQLSLSVRELAKEIASNGEVMPLTGSTFETLDGFGPELVLSESTITSYTCNMGGQMRHELGRLRSGIGTERSLLSDFDTFIFESCRHSSVGGIFVDGEYVLEGELAMTSVDYNASRGSRASNASSWTGFQLQAPSDLNYEVSGSIESSRFSAADFGTGDSRTLDLPLYRKTVAGQETETLEAASLTLNRAIPNGSSESSYFLDANGMVRNLTTGDAHITVDSNPPLSGRGQLASGDIEPFSGQVRMVSSKGGELILSANPDSQISTEPGALLVDLVALRPDGTSLSSDAVSLIDILSGGIVSSCFLEEGSSEDCGAIALP